jgi:hypothetical protein
LTITIGSDPFRDRGEIHRLGIPELTANFFRQQLIPRYEAASFLCLEFSELAEAGWSRMETSWARKLSGNLSRTVFRLSFVLK